MSKDFNSENYVLLEQSLLRLPHNAMRSNFKLSQKYIERDTQLIKNAAEEVFLARNSSPDECLALLDKMITKAETLSLKLANLKNEEDEKVAKSKTRIDHLDELYSIKSIDSPVYDQWNQTRLQRLIVDSFLRQGYFKSAQSLIDINQNLKDLVDVDIFTTCKKIEHSLRNGSTAECLAWCNENKSYLKKANNNLEFEVRLQQHIEFVRAGNIEEAIKYSQKYLVPNADTHLNEILRASGSLVYSTADDADSPYADLFSQDRWTYLASQFIAAHNSLHGLPMPSLLQISLSAGLSALKTPSCKPGAHPISFVSNYNASLCPICSPELHELSKPLPYAHHVRSSVETDPVMLPNGKIYGRETLRQFAEKAGLPKVRVRDPFTGEEWDDSALRRVFPS
ncbi:CTLH/CRA C-terminal to lish motif domain-containing protein [Lipomyces japonicus]|uniref:CTLH/CRA C-terminal to lish motif domain-containing protein n=1 Tax=Lipomyces japonicus TaxID=56871 RepID=UPI0034CE44A1